MPIDDHGLNSTQQLRAHAEQFQKVKTDIERGKRRRRNSDSDPRSIIAIRAAGPDGRFDEVAIEDSGIRDGLAATFSMPAFPYVQDFDRSTRWVAKSTRWVVEKPPSVSQEDSELSSSVEVSSEEFSPTPIPVKRSVASKGRKVVKTKARLPQKPASTAPKSFKSLTSAKAPTASVTYKCYAKGCKYTHARRGNFSIHWKRDAKHKGSFKLGHILQCSLDIKTGKITTIPYGQVKTYRPRPSLERSTGLTDDTSEEDIKAKTPTAKADEGERPIRKRKAAADEESSCEEAPRKIRTRSSTVLAPDTKISLQGPDSPTSAVSASEMKKTLQGSGSPASDVSASDTETSSQEPDSPASDFQINSARANDPRPYTALECKIFKRPKDVPANFPADLTPLISHGVSKSDQASTQESDLRYFCPQCHKCWTQAHNVASHFLKTHGKKYNENDRARTIVCCTPVSKSRANIDAKPVDATILPRLVQLNDERARAKLAKAEMKKSGSGADRSEQDDTALSSSGKEIVSTRSRRKTSGRAVPEQLQPATRGTKPVVRESEEQLGQRSERVQRMYAVRNGILTRTGALTVTDEPEKETAIASKPHTHTRQPSWEGLPNIETQKRTLSMYLKDYDDEEDAGGAEVGSGQVLRGGEDAGGAVVEETPAKRKKMTLGEYTAMKKGAK
jgi:hypothetical protein